MRHESRLAHDAEHHRRLADTPEVDHAPSTRNPTQEAAIDGAEGSSTEAPEARSHNIFPGIEPGSALDHEIKEAIELLRSVGEEPWITRVREETQQRRLTRHLLKSQLGKRAFSRQRRSKHLPQRDGNKSVADQMTSSSSDAAE